MNQSKELATSDGPKLGEVLYSRDHETEKGAPEHTQAGGQGGISDKKKSGE